MRKRVLLVIVVLLAALVLAACTQTTEEATQAPTEEPTVEEVAPPTEEPTPEEVMEPTEVPPTAEPPTEEPAAPMKEPTLITEGLGVAEDLVPTDQEIEDAKAALGDGFIGIIACTYETDYHSTVANAAEQRLEELDVPVQTWDSQVNVETQIQGIENFVASGADVIIICVFDPPSVESALAEAADSGVKIVQYAGRDAAALGGVTISIEDEDLGRVAGEYAAQLINDELGGTAQVAILDYPDIPQVVARAEAIEAALTSDSEAEIVGNYLGGTTENGLQSMETALQANPDINVVVSINDAGAIGAYEVLDAAGRTRDDTIIVGIDADPSAMELIEAGTMYRGTVDTAPAETGVMAANAAIKLMAGGTLPQNVRVPVNLVAGE
ncbi:MAG: sugar ABC transporter substrate-binding protein [Candidatus Promineifilaceae bacterium]